MGEVWRAKDTKLGREVAIKTLPEEFAQDADRLARFEREAKLLASLNHPNIAAIHGFEEDNGTHFLVMELVEGDTLADRLGRGAIPVEESLNLALQIADALKAAHEKGVIHRDLKPANIKVTDDNNVKVLDFGLAKAFAGEEVEASPSNSPTLSMQATQQGVILGTAAYMSPEQAKGRAVDKRADVFAFGCVLYEMLTGRQSFGKSDVTESLSAVISLQPEWTALPPNLHPRLRETVERCLEKRVSERYQDIGDAKADIEKVLADPNGVIVQSDAQVVSKPQSKLPWVAAVVTGVVISGVAVWILKPVFLEVGPVVRFPFVLPEGQAFSGTGTTMVGVSADGTRLAYVAGQIYLRDLDEMESRALEGTAGAASPTFSPDNQFLAYYSVGEQQLKRIAVSGGASVTITDDVRNVYGLNWHRDDSLLFAQTEGVVEVSARDGALDLLIAARDGEALSSPQVLPGDEWVLFATTTAMGLNRWNEAQIVLESLESQVRVELGLVGSHARYVPTGHIVYALDNDLLAVTFDLESLQVTSGPISIAEGVRRGGNPAFRSDTANYDVSASGTLVYLPGSVISVDESGLALVDRNGLSEPLDVPPANYTAPRVSPDGTQLAVSSIELGGSIIWVYDLLGERELRPLAFEGENRDPIWTPDGDSLTFSSLRDGGVSLFQMRADGTGGQRRLTMADVGVLHAPESYSPDGRLSFRQSVGGDWSVWTLSSEEGALPELFKDTPGSTERGSMFSPDGDLIAYFSNEFGSARIYIEPFPPTGGRFQITQTGTNVWPLWAPQGDELIYHDPPLQLMSVDIDTAPSVTWGSPRELPIQTFNPPGTLTSCPMATVW